MWYDPDLSFGGDHEETAQEPLPRSGEWVVGYFGVLGGGPGLRDPPLHPAIPAAFGRFAIPPLIGSIPEITFIGIYN